MPNVKPNIAIKIPLIAGIGKYLTELIYLPIKILLIGYNAMKNQLVMLSKSHKNNS